MALIVLHFTKFASSPWQDLAKFHWPFYARPPLALVTRCSLRNPVRKLYFSVRNSEVPATSTIQFSDVSSFFPSEQ